MRVLLSFEEQYRVYGQAMAAAIQQFRPVVDETKRLRRKAREQEEPNDA